MATLAHARPYRDFLTPALHRRFTDASFYTILLCFIVSVWQGGVDHYIWSWFPIGPAGIRTLLLFIPALVVYILRVAQWHIGRRNTESPWETFKKYTLRRTTFTTVACYSLSAWFFSEVYIWSRSEQARLSFTDQGKNMERIRLNERPLYLRFMFIALAVAQSMVHLWHDYDKIDVPYLKPKNERDAQAAPAQVRPQQVLARKMKSLAKTSVVLALTTFFVGSIVYFMGFRNILWEYYYNLARSVLSVAKTSSPHGLRPFASLATIFIVEGALLTLIWQFVNTAFDLYISQAPFKKDKPITSDSKDPNGSLLNGMKSKRDTIQATAFWELALITDRFPDRRKTIYGELQRKKAATFKQVTDICLAEVRFLTTRISIALDPKFQPIEVDSKTSNTDNISLVPQIAQPLKDAPIQGPGYAPITRMEKLGAFAADIAKTHSSTQNAQNAYAREYLKKGQERYAQEAKRVESLSSDYFAKLVASPFGWPWRQNIRRTASIILASAPYSRISLLCNAITALTNLTVCSLKEDEYGQFQKVVPDIIRVFTSAIKKVDEYTSKLQPHWSDLNAMNLPPEERGKNIPEIKEVRECLGEGLEKILKAFNEYLTGMDMTALEIRDAKKCVARGPEMAVVR